MKNHHDDWRTRLGSILPGRSVGAAAGQWKTLKEEASCPVVVDAGDGVRIVSEEEAAQHVIEFLVKGKEPAPHRPNRAPHKWLLHKWEEEEGDIGEEEEEEEDGRRDGSDESDIVYGGSGDDGTDDDDDDDESDDDGGGGGGAGDRNKQHRGRRHRHRRSNKRGRSECSDEEETALEARSSRKVRRPRCPPESRMIQNVKLEDIDEKEERESGHVPGKRMRLSCGMQRGAVPAADPRARDVKREDVHSVVRKARSPRQRPSRTSCGWSRSLAMIRPDAPGCIRCGKPPGSVPQQDPSAGRESPLLVDVSASCHAMLCYAMLCLMA